MSAATAASSTDPAGAARRPRDAVNRQIVAALPFWLDRPDDEAPDIAREVFPDMLLRLFHGKNTGKLVQALEEGP
jgi:hypothetical protein